MPQLLFPNIAGATLQGFQQGQQMRANRLVGAAMQNPDDAQGYLAQAGAIDPRLALGAQGAMQQQQAQQQAAQQSQQTTTLKQIGGAARYYKAALQSGNPASVQAAKAQIAPLIMRLTGKQLPDSDTPETQAALDNVIAQTAYLFPDDNKLQTITPGSVLTRGGTPVYSNPAQPKITPQGYQAVLGPDGMYHAEPIPIQGAPNGMGMGQAASGTTPGFQGAATSPNGQDVTFNFPPGTPPEVIAAAKASAVANGDLAPGQQVGAPPAQAQPQQPQTLAQVVAASKSGEGSDVIAQRAQQIQELKSRGVTLTDDQRQAYLANGRLPSGSDAILAASMDTPLTPIALDESAVDFILKGPRGLPAYAYRDPVTAKQIQNHAAEMLQQAGLSPDMLPAIRGSAKARESALVKMQAQGSMLGRNIQSLDANVQLMLDAAKKVGNTNFKSWNALVLAAKGQVSDPAVAAYAQAVMNVLDDYGKVLSMSTTNQGVTDGQLRLAQTRISQAEGLPALQATADMIEAGGKNIRDKTDDAIGSLTNALKFGNLAEPTSVTTGADPQPQPQAAPSGWSIEEIH